MRTFKRLSTSLILLLFIQIAFAQKTAHEISIKVSVDEKLTDSFNEQGRIFVFMSLDSVIKAPRKQLWPNPYNKTEIFARNVDDLKKGDPLLLNFDDEWIGTPEWTFKNVPAREYFVQIVWKQVSGTSHVNEPGNLYSKRKRILVDGPNEFSFVLDKTIEPKKVDDHPLARVVEMKSDTLSKWWGKEMFLKASVLLPRDYDGTRSYPIRYNVAGYGGRYTRINGVLNDDDLMQWWTSGDAPEVINVFLDGSGPFGDSYQMDSENSGPYGYSLIHELIPYIEDQYRGTQDATYRFVDGCSTGGWVSLALQLYYPDSFNGVFSYSPDAIAFDNYQLINIYKDENAFVNKFGYERPLLRETSGEPILSTRTFVQYENVLGASNTYVDSGDQFGAHTALYSPKGDDGLPQPLFDPFTGKIDSKVAEHWKKYDLKIYARENWSEVGPKLQDKIYIWMGDMDHFYLNTGTRAFDDFLKTTQNPRSNAVIEYAPTEGHCTQFSHKKVLHQIQDRIDEIEKK